MYAREHARLNTMERERQAALAAQRDAVSYLSGLFVHADATSLTYKLLETVTKNGATYTEYVEHTAPLDAKAIIVEAREFAAKRVKTIADIEPGASISIVFSDQRQTGGIVGSVVALYVTQ
jgi:hypothetical protein